MEVFGNALDSLFDRIRVGWVEANGVTLAVIDKGAEVGEEGAKCLLIGIVNNNAKAVLQEHADCGLTEYASRASDHGSFQVGVVRFGNGCHNKEIKIDRSRDGEKKGWMSNTFKRKGKDRVETQSQSIRNERAVALNAPRCTPRRSCLELMYEGEDGALDRNKPERVGEDERGW